MDANQDPPATPLASSADWAALERSQPGDFDGHTCFAQLTPGERLRWLEQAAEFVFLQKGAASKPANGPLAVAEDPATYRAVDRGPSA